MTNTYKAGAREERSKIMRKVRMMARNGGSFSELIAWIHQRVVRNKAKKGGL